MSGTLRIGVVGGAGWLGSAIASAVLGARVMAPENLALSYRGARPERFSASFWTTDNQELADRSEVIVLSVRPQDWPALLVDAKGKLIISVMAGIRIGTLSKQHQTQRVVRAIPNAAAEVSMSYTPWVASSAVSDDDREVVRAVFEACGTQDEVASENDLDYLTGLTGSGPAFPALLAAAMMDDAVRHGLAADVARRAVTTVLTGTGRLLELRQENPTDIVRTFVDYRGTTAVAIEEMHAAGLDRAVSKGLAAAFKKSASMGDAS